MNSKTDPTSLLSVTLLEILGFKCSVVIVAFTNRRRASKTKGNLTDVSAISPFLMLYPGQQAQDEDSTDSETEEPSMSQEPKETASQPSSTSHRPRAASCRATATWCTDSSSDDSRRWSDQLSLDEKDGFIFVNYSEGQTRAHLQGPLTHAHPNPIEARNYSRLKPGKLRSGLSPCLGVMRQVV